MNIDLEKDIVQSLSSLYPLQEFEERAIDTVLDAIPHWIPVTERLPEEEGEYLVTSVYQYYRDGRKTYKTTVDRWSRNGAGKEWVATSNDAHIAWMPFPEPYKRG